MSTQTKQEQKPSTAMTPWQQGYTGIMALLDKNKGAIAQAATKHLDVDRLTKLALSEMRKTPDLVQCVPASVVASVMQAAQLGLEIGGPLGRAYLVPYNNRKNGKKECQLIIGYKGMIELALRSGMVETVEGYPVYEGDDFDYELGLERKLKHQPCGVEDPAKLTHAYAIVRFKGGGVLFTVLTRKAIEAVRNASPGKNAGPWSQHFPEMAVKTAIRRIFKFTPASPEIARAVGMEEQAEAGLSASDIIDTQIIGAEPEPVAEEAPKGALDQLVEKERASEPSMPERAAKQALEMNAERRAQPAQQQTEIPIDKKPAKKGKGINVNVEGKPAVVDGEVVDADSGQCQWENGDGEACTNEGLMVPGVGYRCGAHPVRGADEGEDDNG